MVGLVGACASLLSLPLVGQTIPASEFEVNAGTGNLSLSSPLSLSGESHSLLSTDFGYESTAHRNALAVRDGTTLTLASGASVAVFNDLNYTTPGSSHTTFARIGFGTDGTLVVEDGASFTVGSANRYANLQIGQGTGATGTVSQSGGDVTVRGSMNLGVNGGTGVYTISGGSLTFDNVTATGVSDANRTSLVSIGFNNSISGTSSGTLNIAGGLVEVAAPHDGGVVSLIVGNRARDALAAYSGTSTNDNNAADGNGTLNQTAGTLRIGAGGTFFLSAYGNGTYNLSGGTLEVGGASLLPQYGSGYTHTFNFGGGTKESGGATLKVIGSSLNTAVNTTLVAGRSIIDTNGFDATFTGNFTSEGAHQIDYGGNGLYKIGAGALHLNGTSRAFDTFAVYGGSADQSAGTTTSVEFMVGSGAGNTGAYTMNGGTLTISPSTNTTGGGVTGSLRIGDFGGTGSFTQNAGTISLNSGPGAASALHVGNQGGTGTYNLTGGTLTLNQALSTIGRAAVGYAASTGTFNLSGGTLQLQNSATLINGNNISGGAASTGTINQTGGTLRIDATSRLFLSGQATSGTGTYNLNGGTLEVGGSSSLQARYNNSTSTYAFNLGGGTIKVSGSDLSTSVNATLTAGTTSSLDTNGLNATWSGALSGDGGLTKTGSGTLNLSHSANSYTGATTLSAGTLNLTGNLTASAITVSSGATLQGSGSAYAVTLASGGTFAPGAGAGSFTITDDLTLSSGSLLSLQLNGLTRGSGYDYVAVGDTFYFGGTLQLSLGNGVSLAAGNSFDFLDWDFKSGTFAALDLPALGAGLAWDSSQLYSTGSLSVTAIPEPSTVALLMGLGACSLVVLRRRLRRC